LGKIYIFISESLFTSDVDYLKIHIGHPLGPITVFLNTFLKNNVLFQFIFFFEESVSCLCITFAIDIKNY